MECKWCYKYTYPEWGKPYRECSVFGPNIPLKYAIEGGCNCTKEFIEVLLKKKFKELCDNKPEGTELDAEDVVNQAIEELYSEHLMLKAINRREFAIDLIANNTALVPIHFCRPDEVEDQEIYVHRAEYYGDCYAGYRTEKYVFDFNSCRVFERKYDSYDINKIFSINELPVTWFFADEETLVFIGNGSIYETFKQEGKKFDTGIFSDKPGVIKRIFLYTPRICENTAPLYKSSLGLDMKGFKENWEQLPECIDLLQRMIELDDEDE